MRLSLYSIHDTLMGVYLVPFAARSDVDARRQIKASLADPQMAQSAIALSPSDYSLCLLARFEDESGEISPVVPPHVLGSVSDVLGGSNAGPVV